MVVKKSGIINIAILLALSSAAYADSNNLTQLDLKRTSNDSVDVTLFTSNNYGENVLVRKKSDNKYVILIPKVQSSGFKASNLNGVKDMVSNIDVKTVPDTSGGYTKVTLITTKPLDIKTRTLKSAPVTAEQKEYQTLIAQANAVKNNISTKQEPPKIREQKTEVTVNKAPAKQVETKTSTPKQNKVAQQDKIKEIKPVEVDSEKLQKQERRQHLAELIQEVKTEQNVSDISSNVPPVEIIEDAYEEMPQIEKKSLLSKVKNKIRNHLPSKKAMSLGLLVLLVIAGLKNIAKKSNARPVNTQQDIDDIIQTSSNQYSNITDNSDLSWKEKYQLYLDKTAKPVSRAGKGNYTFIKSPAKPTVIEQKREDLERMIEETSLAKLSDLEPEIVESEDSSISKTIKLKAFDNQTKSLKMTKRAHSRFKKYDIPMPEQKTIDLGDSALYSNPRSLSDANLDVASVDKNRIKFKNQDYIMSSVDEYLSILDKEQSAQNVSVQPVEIEKPSISNPIAAQKKENKSSYLKGLIVKSGYKIDDKKGFYLINKNGQNSLIGKVNDEVFVLKNFKDSVTNPIQVRRDNDNVYMVKAGGFKSLVEVNDDKMGVLIEL